MRALTLLVLAMSTVGSVGSTAAGHEWKTGAWAFPPDGRLYVIESPTQFITGEATDAETAPASATAGQSVQYAVEQRTLLVRGADQHEHALRLVSAAPKYSPSYTALGGGHYIKAVTPNGARVTLEDGSRWDIDARVQFEVAEWEPDDLISVRRSNDDNAFAFEIDNTSRDDGALTNRLAR